MQQQQQQAPEQTVERLTHADAGAAGGSAPRNAPLTPKQLINMWERKKWDKAQAAGTTGRSPSALWARSAAACVAAAAPGDAIPVPTPAEGAGCAPEEEGELTEEEYAEMVEEMSAEEVMRACEEEGIPAELTLDVDSAKVRLGPPPGRKHLQTRGSNKSAAPNWPRTTKAHACSARC